MIVLSSSQKDCPQAPSWYVGPTLDFFGDNYFGKKFLNEVQRWKHLRRFINFYNHRIYNDEE